MHLVLPIMAAGLGSLGALFAARGFVLFKAALVARQQMALRSSDAVPVSGPSAAHAAPTFDRADRYSATGFACLGAGFFILILSFLQPS